VIIAAMGIAFFFPPVGVGLSIAAGIARVDIDEVSRVLSVSGGPADRACAIAAFGVHAILPRLFRLERVDAKTHPERRRANAECRAETRFPACTARGTRIAANA
jgi:hypothetical protein